MHFLIDNKSLQTNILIQETSLSPLSSPVLLSTSVPHIGSPQNDQTPAESLRQPLNPLKGTFSEVEPEAVYIISDRCGMVNIPAASANLY